MLVLVLLFLFACSSEPRSVTLEGLGSEPDGFEVTERVFVEGFAIRPRNSVTFLTAGASASRARRRCRSSRPPDLAARAESSSGRDTTQVWADGWERSERVREPATVGGGVSVATPGARKVAVPPERAPAILGYGVAQHAYGELDLYAAAIWSPDAHAARNFPAEVPPSEHRRPQLPFFAADSHLTFGAASSVDVELDGNGRTVPSA